MPKLHLTLLIVIATALGFAGRLNVFPALKQDRLGHVDTYIFAGGYQQPEQLLSGWQQPERGEWGTKSMGSRSELAIPVEFTADDDIKLEFDFSVAPDFAKRAI